MKILEGIKNEVEDSTTQPTPDAEFYGFYEKIVAQSSGEITKRAF